MAWVGAGMMLVLAVLMGVSAVKIRRGTLHRNPWMGIRVTATMASDEAWDAAHRHALPWYAAAAAVSAIGTLGFVAAGLARVSEPAVFPWYLGSLVLVAVLILIPTPGAIGAAKGATPQGGEPG